MSGPVAEPGFAGRIAHTVAESEPWWPERPESARGPNVVTIVFDDAGWSDFGCFGSEIDTPNIDRLAAGGLRYTDFTVAPLCSPTRAALMTGRNHHRVGLRFLAANDTGFPNARGRLHPDVPTLPEQLRAHGYGTYLAGKWHLTPSHECGAAGPYGNWPLRRGFDRFYGFLSGAADQYCPELVQDNTLIEPPEREGYHLSEDLVDQAISYTSDHLALRPADPFYLHLGFGAQHAPHQVPRRYADPYIERFDKGWESCRAERLARQIGLGLVPEGTELTEHDPRVPAWDALSADERRLATRLQATFAGFLEHTDAQIGRLVDRLAEAGVLDDTLIMVMSDHGAANDGGPVGDLSVIGPYNAIRRTADDQLADLDQAGGQLGPSHYPSGWAMAGNTPYRLYKEYVDLGGVRSPLVVHWPAGISDPGGVRHQFANAVDVMPTVLAAAGLPQAADPDGASMAATFTDRSAPPARDTQYFEMLGHRALWHRGWRAVTTHETGRPYDEDVWRLYRPGDVNERLDVAAEHPDMLRRLQELWWREAAANDVFPLDDRPMKQLLGARSPAGVHSLTRLRLRPGQSHLPFLTRTAALDRSQSARARLRGRTGAEEGTLLSTGLAYGGYSLHVLDGHLYFEHLVLGERTVCRSAERIPDGDVTVGFDLDRHADRSASVVLRVDGHESGRAEIPLTVGQPAFWGLDVGCVRGSSMAATHEGRGAFRYPDTGLVDVVLDFGWSPTRIADEAHLLEASQ